MIGLRIGATVPLKSAPTLSDVTYRLSGTAKRVVVTSESPEQTVSLPWQTFAKVPSGGELYISARNDTASGTIACEIVIAGRVLDTATHDGSGQRVACTAHAP